MFRTANERCDVSTATLKASETTSEALIDLALKDLLEAHKASTPGKWEFWKTAGPETIAHGVLVPYGGKRLLATHFMREEDSRFVVVAHDRMSDLLQRVREVRIQEEMTKKRLTDALNETRAQAEKLDADLKKGCEALKKEMESRKSAESLAEGCKKQITELVELTGKRDKEITELKAQVAKLLAVPPAPARPVFKRTGKRYLLTNLAHPKQLPFKGAKFDMDVLTLEQAQALLADGFQSGIPIRRDERSNLLLNLSNLLTVKVSPRSGHVNLNPGDDAIIVSYEGPHYPDGELHGQDFNLWQTYLRWNHLKVVA